MKKETLVESANNLPNYIEDVSKNETARVLGEFDRIVISGVDNSVIAGLMLENYLSEIGRRIPIFINESFEIPIWANSKTLMFIVSYSGSDLEAIKCYRASVGRGCKIVVISSDGKLKQMTQENNVSFIKLPENLDSRIGLFLSFISIVQTLRSNDFLKEEIDFMKIARVLRKPSFNDNANLLAQKLISKLPVIYSSKRFSSVGFAWKRFFNVNSKIVSFYNTLPEAAYSDLEGYETSPDNVYTIFLRDNSENKHINKQIDSMKLLLKDKVKVSELKISGDNYLTKLLSTIYFGLLVSIKLGELIENDIESHAKIDKVKKDLKSIY